MRIYVASSWRNELQPAVVRALREDGHDVYDFRNPAPGDNGFSWSEIDPNWQQWNALEFRRCLQHQVATDGFGKDMSALAGCDAAALILPCNRSAHLELGWACGACKRTAVLLVDGSEPELMYRMVDGLCVTLDELRDWAKETAWELDTGCRTHRQRPWSVQRGAGLRENA